MSAERKALRADLLAAVEDVRQTLPEFLDHPLILAWSQNLDPSVLPVIGIAVPSEQRRALSQDVDEQDFRAIVVVKTACPGNDSTQAEDALDDLAEAFGGPVEAALMTDTRDVALQSSAIEISAAGSPRVGTLTLTYAVQTLRARTRP